jgi:beta-N-acetylhexosaminidase
VIGVRSFGSAPELVARHVVAFVEGLQSRGVIACAKHFPGHGATELDSHHELPTVDVDSDELRRVELAPFRAAVEAGVKAIMTAHIVVPSVDALPATISRAHIDGLLRQELGFTGLVMTDALEMRAISGTVGVADGAILSLAAGADALCLGSDLQGEAVGGVRDAIVGAVRDGRLVEDRLAEAAERVEAAGAWSRQERAAAAPESAVGLAAARRALQADGNVRLTGPALVVECVPQSTMAADPARHGLGGILRELDSRTESIRLDGAVEDVGALAAAANGLQVVLVVRDPQRHDWERSLAERLLARCPGAVLVDVGYPDWRPEGAAGRLTTFGASRASLVAAAERLTGRP